MQSLFCYFPFSENGAGGLSRYCGGLRVKKKCEVTGIGLWTDRITNTTCLNLILTCLLI